MSVVMGMPYTTCVRIRPLMVPYRRSSRSTSTSGTSTLWYGMNMPNRMAANSRLEPGKRHLEST